MWQTIIHLEQLPFRTVLIDSWYATTPVMKAIEKANKIYYYPPKTNWGYVRNSLTTDVSNRNGFAGPFNGWQQSEDYQNREIFADTFIGWVYGRWETDALGLTDAAKLKVGFMANL